MNVQVFIFNYAHFSSALKLFYDFTNLKFDTYLINCESPNDPEFEETDKIKKFPNIYYSGQWNEALKLFTADVGLFVNSDVKLTEMERIMNRLRKFYRTFGKRAGIYAPNVSWTPWTYNPKLLPEVRAGYKIVPGTDSVIWSVTKPIAFKLGPIDLSVNKLGWGIELVASYYCFLESKLVVRDYMVKCFHPRATSYNRNNADRQWKEMINRMKIGKQFWNYYDTIHRYQFGWNGNYETELKFKKMNL